MPKFGFYADETDACIISDTVHLCIYKQHLKCFIYNWLTFMKYSQNV